MAMLVSYSALVAALVFGPQVLAKLSTAPATPCTATMLRATTADLTVPPGAICRVTGSTVNGSVTVQRDAYFEASGTRITGSIRATGALTVFLHGGTSVAGSVLITQTPQLFLYQTTVVGSVKVAGAIAPGFGHVQVCDTTAGRIDVRGSGPDVLVGDPPGGCPGNRVKSDVFIAGNVTMSELEVSGNTISGSLTVAGNTGAAAQHVTANTVGGAVNVSGGAAPSGSASY